MCALARNGLTVDCCPQRSKTQRDLVTDVSQREETLGDSKINAKTARASPCSLLTWDYVQDLERRRVEIENRTDLSPAHRERVQRSYHEMMQQYRREIKLYEVMQEQGTRRT